MPRAEARRLTESQVRRVIGPLLDELGATNRRRVESILPLFAEGAARLSDCLAAVFPDLGAKDAQDRLRVFRKAVNDAAVEHGVALELKVDTKLKDPPKSRRCWFEGESGTEREVEEFSRSSTADVERAGARGELIRSRAVATTGAALERDRREVRFFVSYAHDDQRAWVDLDNLLQIQLGPSERYRYVTWSDAMIEVGARWHEEIQAAIDACDFGLLIVSPSFLASQYITREELPHFVHGRKPMIPVALKPISFMRHDLKGLQERQIFFLGRGKQRKAFGELRGSRREEFARELFEQVEERLSWYFDSAPDPGDGRSSTGRRRRSQQQTERDEFLEAQVPEKIKPFIRTRGAVWDLRDLERRDVPGDPSERGTDALAYLHDWAGNPDERPFCAVLGEYGIGKTTTLKQLARELLDRRHNGDKRAPLPIFVDLKDYVARSGVETEVPTLEEILAEVIRRNWPAGSTPSLTPAEVIEMVQSQGALVVFDGLDEKIVHLTPDRARAFIRELWRILPPAARRAETKDTPGVTSARRGKMLLSCRSHYFKDVLSQNSMLTGQEREGVRAEDYRACILLPFRDDQVRAYLSAVLGAEEQVDAALDLFQSVHNLKELAQRPYLLSVMSEQIEDLERRRARGETVRGVTLYENLVRRWLARDDGKHLFTHAHKRQLMQQLAADMWLAGTREWPWERVERWLDAFLARRPDVADRYRGRPAEVLNEDLRTATFVLRAEDARAGFRFAHTSLQEFFLAEYLERGLTEHEPDRWAMPLPSLETLDFVGQLLEGGAEGEPIRCLERLLVGGDRDAARLAFRYWLLAVERGYPQPTPAQVDLSGIDLERWTVRGAAERPLSLRGASLSRCNLDHARIADIDLRGAGLQDASLCVAELERVNLAGADLNGADFTGTVLRECDGTRLRGKAARWRETEWIRSRLDAADLGDEFRSSAIVALCDVSASARSPSVTFSPAEAIVRSGHSGPVSACAWSPDGARVLSAADDQTLRVWDADTGQCLRELRGHRGPVLTCAWAPDGTHVLSAAADQTLCVWDADTGRCLRELSGHHGGVLACAWSPDGARVLSAAADRTLRVWDVDTGQCLRELTAHRG